MKKRCWAACLGNCKGELTGEHIYSQGTIRSKTITVQGLPWCESEPTTIGIKTFTANILCDKHNSDLSPVDGEGIRFLEQMEAALILDAERRKDKKPGWPMYHRHADGPLLARWFLKTTINCCVIEEKFPIGASNAEVGQPSRHLVEIAYGLKPFIAHAGLYGGAFVGLTNANLDRKGFTAFVCTPEGAVPFVCMGVFVFAGWPFVISFLTNRAPPGISMGGTPLTLLKPMRTILMPIGKHHSQRFDFRWSDHHQKRRRGR